MSIRSLLLTLGAAVVVLTTGASTAYAGPAPLVEPDKSGVTAPTGSGDSGFSLTDWVQLSLVIALTVAVVALIAVVVARHRHHAPSAA